jgi:hypothetical protein
MHRFLWDLHYDPIPVEDVSDNGDEEATGAVPHHTYAAVNSPWMPPGSYNVRLTVEGRTFTQPINLRLDPRVKTPAAGLAQLATLSREMYDAALATHTAFVQARGLAAELSKLTGSDVDAFRAQVESLAPAPVRDPRAFFRRRGATVEPPTLDGASGALMAAAMAMQGADVTPTAAEVAACAAARTQAAPVMPKWAALSTSGLAGLNAKRRAAGLPAVSMPR